MTDPYQILGISRDASDDEIKKAYRTLSRKYHPDANINNPNKDYAEAKFKEIQQAYQQIIKEKESGYSTGSGSYGGTGSYGADDPFGGFGSFWESFGGMGSGSYQQANTASDSEEDLHLRQAVAVGRTCAVSCCSTDR